MFEEDILDHVVNGLTLISNLSYDVQSILFIICSCKDIWWEKYSRLCEDNKMKITVRMKKEFMSKFLEICLLDDTSEMLVSSCISRNNTSKKSSRTVYRFYNHCADQFLNSDKDVSLDYKNKLFTMLDMAIARHPNCLTQKQMKELNNRFDN